MSAVSQARAFGKYEVLEQIAAGDTSEIFKARLSGIGGFQRHLAIKRIRPHLNSSTEFINELTNEARLAGLLSHANIVQIIDLGQVEQAWFVAMEFVNGPDLRRVIERCSKKGITLPVPHAVFICIELLKGLEYAHNRQVMRGGRLVPLKIVHRNLCPEKILISSQGEVKLADFVAVSRGGHPDYCSPEQRHDKATTLSDIYSAGVMLYEMLTGIRPATEAAPASHINPDIPYQLEVIVERAIHVDPKRRFPSTTALKDALDSFFHDAGFIFSHSTLASFLRSLFPEGRPAPRPFGEQETRPIQRSDLSSPSAEAGQSTEAMVRENREMLLAPAEEPEAPQPPALLDDLPTHIESPVNLREHFPIADSSVRYTQPILADAPEEETLISRAVDVWSDAQTVIKKDPTTGSETTQTTSSEPRAPKPDAAPQEAQSLSQTPSSASPRRERPTEAGERRIERQRRASQRFLILFSALSVVAMVLMLFLGFFIGSRTPPAQESTPMAEPLPLPKPRVEVRLPTGALLYLNNRPVPDAEAADFEVESEALQVLKVELDDHYPMEVELRLAPGEVRVVSFEAITLQPRRR